MKGEPPDQDPWDDVVSQVADALADLNLTDGPLRSALLDGLRSALDQVGGGLGTPPAPSVPEVVVVEGGRAADAPPSLGQRPELRVADDPTEEDVPEVRTHVRVVRVGADQEPIEEPDWLSIPISHEGRIRVGEPTTQAGWQTVLRAQSVRAYRLNCERGALEIFLEGEAAERLAAGQTVDVEAQLIRVRAAGPNGAEGSYVRL
jgi:hypothetical protein